MNTTLLSVQKHSFVEFISMEKSKRFMSHILGFYGYIGKLLRKHRIKTGVKPYRPYLSSQTPP